MKEFKLEIDTNTIYVKALRFIGSVGVGFAISTIFFSLEHGIEIDWITEFTFILFSLAFALFPGFKNRNFLTVNELGIFTHPLNKAYWTGQYEFYWDKIDSVGLEKNHIKIKQVKKSTDRIRLPVYTKDQWKELKSYLEEAAHFKQVEFKEH